MNRRKRIALLTAQIEAVHERQSIDGILRQCQKYDYDLCVFSTMVHLDFPRPHYLMGESNIFRLADFSAMDGVILDGTALNGDPTGTVIRRICEQLSAFPMLTVCVLQMPIEGYPLIECSNEPILRELCRHMIEVHHKTRLCVMTGQKGNYVAEHRLSVMLDEIRRHRLNVLPEHILYGDFWYSSGDRLADQLLSGEISMPEAVLCASDHMALGLIEKLQKHGIRVPEDLLVIGFDATDEGAACQTPLSSYDASGVQLGADAVDWLRERMEPGAPVQPYVMDSDSMFRPGTSCGCQSSLTRTVDSMRHALYFTSRNYVDPELTRHADVGLLMESYLFENLTGSDTPEECMRYIYENSYHLNPFRNLYLCLREDWMDIDSDRYEGYPDTMRIVVAESDVGEESFYQTGKHITFPTKQMIPKLHEPRELASVFYFLPVHFDGKLLGYTVLQRDISERFKVNLVCRNWLRFINNALEMIRTKKRLQTFSVRDEMTGTLNRRGMYTHLEQVLPQMAEHDRLLACVIDMDGLKYINDTFGHLEGDFGIKLVSAAAAAVTEPHEICIRAGGDEFYLIGTGSYAPDAAEQKKQAFLQALAQKAALYDKPYSITASIGAVLCDAHTMQEAEEALSRADEQMYQFKTSRKKQRQ